MEPVTMAVIGTVVFGAVAALSVFVRQMILSRDKHLNDIAQRRALAIETSELNKIREEMESSRRFDSHYQVLGENKDAIHYLDEKIDEILKKKLALIERYAQLAMKESSALIEGARLEERKRVFDLLSEEIERELACYDEELLQLQTRRGSIWDAHTDLQEYLLAQEKARSEKLDALYQYHSAILEKIYHRHSEQAAALAKETLEAGTQSFNLLEAPFRILIQFFTVSTGVDPKRATDELASRRQVAELERSINQGGFAKDDKSSKLMGTPELVPEFT